MDTITYLRQFRVGQFAVFDFAASYIGIAILSPLITWLFAKIGVRMSFAAQMWLVLPVSVLAHLLVGRMTPLTQMVMNPTGGIVAKGVVFFMLVMAFREILYK